jgi:hypothetical protein
LRDIQRSGGLRYGGRRHVDFTPDGLQIGERQALLRWHFPLRGLKPFSCGAEDCRNLFVVVASLGHVRKVSLEH